VGDKLTVQAGKLLLTQAFALVYGKSEGVQNANSQLLRGRGDYAFASRLAAYGFVGYALAKSDRMLTTGVQISY